MEFFSAPDVEWLYSGVTKTNPSNEAIFSAQALVCGRLYWPIEGGIASSRCGRLYSAMSTSSYSASLRCLATSSTQRATASPLRPGRVLPRMMPILITAALPFLSTTNAATPALPTQTRGREMVGQAEASHPDGVCRRARHFSGTRGD